MNPNPPRVPNLEIDEVYGSRALPPHHVCNEALRPGDMVILDGRPATLLVVKVPQPIDGSPIRVAGNVVGRDDVPGESVAYELPGGKLTFLIARAEVPTGYWWVSWYSRFEPPVRSRLAVVLESMLTTSVDEDHPDGFAEGRVRLLRVPSNALRVWCTDQALPKPGALALLLADATPEETAALTALLDRPLGEVTPFADLAAAATMREYMERDSRWLVQHVQRWTAKRRSAALHNGSLIPEDGPADPSVPFEYWCTGETMHDPPWGTYCGTIPAPTRAAAFARVQAFIPDAMHRFSRPCAADDPTSDRFPRTTP